MTPRLPYAYKDSMSAEGLTNFARLGGRFRSRPGAPMATPPSGLTTGSLSTTTPQQITNRDATWGKTFGGNSVYGTRNAPAGSQSAAQPIAGTTPQDAGSTVGMGPETSVFLTADDFRHGPKASPLTQISNPDDPLETGSGPRTSTSDPLASTVAQLEAWHQQTGTPLPDRAPPGVNPNVTDSILKKYQTPGTTARTDYSPVLASLSEDAPIY